MKRTLSVTRKFLIFISIFFILAVVYSWFFISSIKGLDKYANISKPLTSIKGDIVILEYRLDIFVIGGDFQKHYGTEGLNEQVANINKALEQMNGLPDSTIFNSNPMLSGDYKALINDWNFVMEKIRGLKNVASKEEVFLIHNDVDLKLFLIIGQLERLIQFLDARKANEFSNLDSRIIYSLLSSVVITLIASYLFYRSAIRPINYMASTAKKMAAGDLKVRLKAVSHDEIGVLASTFNKMADDMNEAHATLEKNVSNKTMELEQRTNELTAMNRVASAMGRTLAKEEIAGIALDELIFATKADAGWVYLIKQNNDAGSETKLHLEVHRGLHPSFLKEAREVRLEDGGIIGKPIKEKKHLLISISEVDSRFRRHLENMGFQMVCILPIIHADGVIGLINLASKKPDCFSNNETILCIFAESIAKEMANAVEYINLFQKEFRSRQFMERIVYQSPVSMVVFDKTGTCVMINPAYRRLFGIGRDDQVLGKYNIFKDNVLEEKGYNQMIRKVWEGETVELETEYDISKVGHIHPPQADEGRPKKLRIRVFPIIDNDGSISNMVAMHEDVTNKDQLKNQSFMSDKLSAISQLVTSIISNIHNPLTDIVGQTQLLIGKTVDASQKDALERITREAERISTIVKNLLVFTRGYKLQKSYININDVLSTVLELMAYDLKVNNMEVVKEFEDSIPWTMADPFQLQQVFLNIINNAMDAIKEQEAKTGLHGEHTRGKNEHNRGRIVIKTLHCKPGGEIECSTCQQWGGEGIMIRFTDNGPGIPEENQKRLFAPFFTTKVNRAGLGLSLSYGIVKEHGGTIHVKSKVGSATTFDIEIPVLKESVAR
jgi:PAS domain S-box-containing protein